MRCGLMQSPLAFPSVYTAQEKEAPKLRRVANYCGYATSGWGQAQARGGSIYLLAGGSPAGTG